MATVTELELVTSRTGAILTALAPVLNCGERPTTSPATQPCAPPASRIIRTAQKCMP